MIELQIKTRGWYYMPVFVRMIKFIKIWNNRIQRRWEWFWLIDNVD
jgi:hypothetical protein